MHYCTGHKHSTETVINASSLINKIDHYYAQTVKSQYKCPSWLSKAANLSHSQGFAIANLFMILVVSISHRRSCYMFFRITLFNGFCLTVLINLGANFIRVMKFCFCTLHGIYYGKDTWHSRIKIPSCDLRFSFHKLLCHKACILYVKSVLKWAVNGKITYFFKNPTHFEAFCLALMQNEKLCGLCMREFCVLSSWMISVFWDEYMCLPILPVKWSHRSLTIYVDRFLLILALQWYFSKIVAVLCKDRFLKINFRWKSSMLIA